MKIVYLADSVIPSQFANSVNVMNMCSSMANLGHNVHLIIPDFVKYEGTEEEVFSFYGLPPNFTIHRLNSYLIPLLGYWWFAWTSFIRVKKIQPDLLIGRNYYALYLCSRLNKKSVLELHGLVERGSPLRSWVFKKLLTSRNLVAITFNSGRLKEIFISMFPSCKSMALVVAPNGSSAVPDNLLAEHENGKLRIGYFGSLYKGRGVELILEIAKKLPYCEFFIYGGSPEEIELLKQMHSDQLNVVFKGFVAPGKVQVERANCNILVAPYQRKTLINNGQNTADYMSPVKLFEYMASQRAIICSDLPAIREVISPSCALLVTPDNDQEWVEAVKSLEQPDKRATLAKNALQEYRTNYSWNIRAQRILDNVDHPESGC